MVTPMHPEEGSYPRRYRDLVRAQHLLERRDACLPLKILVTATLIDSTREKCEKVSKAIEVELNTLEQTRHAET